MEIEAGTGRERTQTDDKTNKKQKLQRMHGTDEEEAREACQRTHRNI